MILSNEGRVIIDGNAFDTLAEFICVIASIKETIESKVDAETAMGIIAECGRVAFLPNDEIDKQIHSAEFHEMLKPFRR